MMAIDGQKKDKDIKRLQAHLPTLGPHAGLLLKELLNAQRIGQPASVIMLGVAVLDVALREPTGQHGGADGITQATARDSRDAAWLRQRRNGIVHYEGGRGGLMGEEESGKDSVLMKDAVRAISILADALDTLNPVGESGGGSGGN